MVQITQNHPYVTLRVKFQKLGSLQYISHLDLVRTMMKIITRAKLPLWYTEGFNPKPKIVFAAPLSIGTESVCEYMDIKMIDDPSPEDVIRRLNENMTEEMQVLDAYYTEVKLTEMKWLTYHIEITTENADHDMAERCRNVLDGERIEVAKKAPKRGETPKVMDIKPLIKSADVRFDEASGKLVIDAMLSADASAFLNPEYLIKALREYAGILASPCLTREYYSIMRLEAYKEDLTPFR